MYLSVSTSARRILGMENVISTPWTSDFNYMLKDQKVLTRKDNTNEMTCVKNYGGHILSLCILACFLRMILWTVIQARSYWWKLKFLYSIQEVVLLCPVRVLKIYISAAKHLRNGLKNLFVLYKKKEANPAQTAFKDSTTKWIIIFKTMESAYIQVNVWRELVHLMWRAFQHLGFCFTDFMEAAKIFSMKDGRSEIASAHTHWFLMRLDSFLIFD